MTPGSVCVDGNLHTLGSAPHLTVGRHADNDIVVDHPLVADHHLHIDWRGHAWLLTAADAEAAMFAAGRPVTELTVTGVVQVHLGSPGRGPVLVVALADDRLATAERDGNPFGGGHPTWGVASPMPRRLRGAPHLRPMRQNADGGAVLSLRDGVCTIGRSPDNDLVVDDMLASRRHARITTGTEIRIEDLGSINGTHVNGHRVDRSVLHDGDAVTVGNSDFLVSGRALIRGRAHGAVDDGLQLHGVGLIVDGDKQLLRDVEFSAAPGTLTAVIGPSGAGKSTVSKVAAGLQMPTGGQVTFEGRDVHADYDALRTRIGMVPQQDVLHHKLTLRQALRYAAELRLPPDLSADDRDTVIGGVLGELQLLEHLDTRVDKLSGGQRKRASVAMELLTGPSLLILDEPTSGLDPALDRQVMATLRRLADAGRVVVVVTHSLTYLSMCDQVLLLAPGGQTAFVGAPAEVVSAMGTDDWAEIFAFVAAHPDTAHERHRRTRQPSPPMAPRPPGPAAAAPRGSALRQADTIARRQIRLILADTGYLVFLVVMPIVLGLLTLVIPGSEGFAVNRAPDTAGEALQVLVILTVGATFMGTALTVRDLVAERDIYERERAVGLQPGAYLSAKVIVFGAAAIIQTFVMVAITYVGKGVPAGGVIGPAPFELFCAVAALACVSTLVGLTISATVRSTEQTMPPMVIVVISQLVFCGGLFRLTTPGLQQLSWLFPSYWGYAVSAASVDLNTISPLAPQTAGAQLWEPSIMTLVLGYSALLLTATVLLGVTASKLRLERPAPPRPASAVTRP
ncbi:ATP-binding cassette domain-containing protein [Gordonia sp. SID5947]|uniref:ATP-binding cassette domain-containing protein n=1 Tax=Gordonia sp. SID5947 TaxID=2690315 RepID=UPI00136CAFDA|nr:ATP-binding cassette domain-containing protein [Gordonia sp. SID5947]MYR08265.1 ATP-binding cassette domain-containing protein [Gordonia sp. SID5947]